MSAATATMRIDANRASKFAGKLLVASSRAEFRAHILQAVEPAASRPSEAAGGADALIQLEAGEFATLVLDPLIEDLDLNELVETIRRRFPEVDIVVPETNNTATQLPLEQLTLELAGSSAREEMQGEAKRSKTRCSRLNIFPKHLCAPLQRNRSESKRCRG